MFASKTVRTLGILVFIGAVAYGVHAYFNATPKELVTIQVSPKWLNQAQFAGMFVAEEKGFYARRGLRVEFKEFQAGNSVLDDVISGESAFGYANPTELLQARSSGESVTGIAAMYQFSPYAIVSLREKNIASPRQLKDKRIGVKGNRGAESETVFALLLSAAGLTTDDVETVYIPFGTSESEDLLADTADAIGMYRTRLNVFDEAGLLYDVLSPDQYGSPVYNDVIIARDDFLAENPDIAKAFLRATADGWRYAFKNKAEAVDITLGYVTDAQYQDRAYQLFILEESQPLIQPTLQTRIGEMDATRWNSFYEVMLERDLLTVPFEVTDAYSDVYLP